MEAIMSFDIQTFFDARTWTLTYVLFDQTTRDAVIIDPVLDYEPVGSKVWTESADEVIAFLRARRLVPHLILETHAHADHLSGSQHIKEAFPMAKVAIGAEIRTVQRLFKTVFDLPPDFPTDGSQFDLLLEDGQTVRAGSLSFDVIYTPGHTPACATYRFGDTVFTGDTLFMPDIGTGRCDFPAGSSDDLYTSVHERLYTPPEHTRVFVGHDYPPESRDVAYETTIGASKELNVALPAARGREDFVAWRDARDRTLSAPRLLYQSVQVNVDAGALPPEHANAKRYLKIPINIFKPTPEPASIDLATLDEAAS